MVVEICLEVGGGGGGGGRRVEERGCEFGYILTHWSPKLISSSFLYEINV